MRIEELNKASVPKLSNRELLNLRLRCSQLWDKNFKDNDVDVVGSLNRNRFLKQYKLVLDELKVKTLNNSTDDIDRALFKKAMDAVKYGIDVSDFGDITLAREYVSIGTVFAKGFKDAEELEVLISGIPDEVEDIVVNAIQKQIGKSVLPLDGLIEEDYIPLFDLVLKARDKTEITKPYPNFHAARMKNPSAFARIVVLQTLPNGVMVYGGPLKSDPRGSSKTQAYRFPKDKFTVAEAKKWLKDLDKEYTLFEPATGKTAKAIWSARFINDLPDSAFLYIEPGGEKDDEGKTKPRSLRHFPYKGADGKVDLPHLRNAIARIPQSKLSASVKNKVQAKAKKLLEDMKEEKKFEKGIRMIPIDKADKDEHICCGIVYEPDVEDAQGDKADETEIRKAAYQFMEEVQKIKVNHEGRPIKARVLESYIAPQDLTIAGQSVKKGTWLMTTRILDAKVWKSIKAGELTGYSMAGYARAG